MHTNILVILNLLLFNVVIFEIVTLEQLYLAVTLFVCAQLVLIFICTIILAFYELACVPLAALNICKWSYICSTFCWNIEILEKIVSPLLIPQLEFRCNCYTLLTSYFVVSSFISKTTLLLPLLNSFALFWFFWWDCQNPECCFETVLRVFSNLW